jgi:outer membrane translocation and assembly module TamA
MNYDDRDNMFTPRTGTYAEVSAGFCGKIFGGDDEFQRVQLMAMQYFGLEPSLFLGMKGLISANFGDAPFYLYPFIYMRGVPAMRYLGEQVAQAETEMRWQFWKRFSLVGFMGVGYAWTDLEKFQNTQSTLAGGVGFRYELTRKYGIHMGLDLAYGPDEPVIYITVGSAWVRP